jgi:hypothetical protein
LRLVRVQGDKSAEIDGAGMVDPRVTHLWDGGKVIGQPFLERFGVDFGGLDYDFLLLFGPDAVWGQAPAGATVIGERERLARELTPLLD